ncbi:extensin-like [Sus scrofa]|uniref:extensin-like n=1 Tax=Sus scrofa TaxID=9823 RepID=UPI000A2AF5B2|nr:extensin-like [Sus scrofa]
MSPPTTFLIHGQFVTGSASSLTRRARQKEEPGCLNPEPGLPFPARPPKSQPDAFPGTPPPPLPPTTHPEISRSHLKQESPRAGPPGHDTSKAHQEFRDDWLIFIPQLCTKQFYRAVPVFSEALFAPRSTGWAFLVDKVQARAGEDSCPFTKGCDTALPPQTHTHAHTIHTHTCTPPTTHVPPGRTPHTSLMNPPPPTHTSPTVPAHPHPTHAQSIPGSLSPHPTQTHNPLTYTFHTPREPPPPTSSPTAHVFTHTPQHTPKDLTLTWPPPSIHPVLTHTPSHLPGTYEKHTPREANTPTPAPATRAKGMEGAQA